MVIFLSASVFALLGLAVVIDVRSHRIPNNLILLGFILSLVLQVGLFQIYGFFYWAGGLVAGFLCFLPLYMFGGMAAGDVKLMAVVGGFLGPVSAFWAAAFTLIVGGVLGVVILLYKKQLISFIKKYIAIENLHTYLHSEADDDVARQRFPYAIAILVGTLTSILWQPLGQ